MLTSLPSDVLRDKIAPLLQVRDLVDLAHACQHTRASLRDYVSKTGDRNLDTLYRIAYNPRLDVKRKRELLRLHMKYYPAGREEQIHHLVSISEAK